jgi:hypothetical protein
MIKKVKKNNKEQGLVSLDHRREKHLFVIVDDKKNALITAPFSDVLHYECVAHLACALSSHSSECLTSRISSTSCCPGRQTRSSWCTCSPGFALHEATFHTHPAQQAGARHNVAGFYLSFTAQADR